MKRVLFAIAAASVLAAGCATPQTATPSTEAATTERATGERITGSRLPRSADENPQGTKSMSRQEYEVNKPPQGMKPGG